MCCRLELLFTRLAACTKSSAVSILSGEGFTALPLYFFREEKMLGQVIEILNALGMLQVIQFVAIMIGTIFIFRYFTDRS